MNGLNNPIKPFHFWVQPILPLVYDDSLSYLEVLYKVSSKLNDVIQWANDFQDNLQDEISKQIEEASKQTLAQLLEELQNQLVPINSQISTIENNITTINTDISSLNSQLDSITPQLDSLSNDFLSFKSKITSDLEKTNSDLQAQILAQTIYINTQIQTLTDLINSNSELANSYTNEKFKELLDMINNINLDVVYPSNNETVSIQTAINLLYNAINTGALTAVEYDNLELTAEQYDNKNLTAYQYDTMGRIYLIGGSNPGSDSNIPLPSSNDNGKVLTADTSIDPPFKWELINSTNQIYSENEIAIGKWIDNKTIYRNVFNFTSPTTSSLSPTLPVFNLNFNIDTIISFKAFLLTVSNQITSIPYYLSNTDYAYIAINLYNATFEPNTIRMNVAPNKTERPCFVIIEYTKEE